MTADRRDIPARVRGGFTLMELIVAVAITAVMLLMVNQIFNSASRSMNMGIALSDMIGNQRGFGDQLELDAEAMIGPDENTDEAGDEFDKGGILVIVQYMVPSALTNRGPNLSERTRSIDNDPPNAVRSDQLMFFRKRDTGKPKPVPMTPQRRDTYLNTFRSDPDDASTEYHAEYMRIWLGHARKTLPDGTDYVGPDLGFNAANPLTINTHAQDWVLARQALFLVDERDPYEPLAANDIHADRAAYNARVRGDSTPPWPPSDRRLYRGTTDIAAQVLGSAMISTGSGNGPYDTPSILRYLTMNGTRASDAPVYRNRVYDYLYLYERLRANPNPLYDPTDATHSYAAWQVAQMHPVVFAGISDFIVEFAADIENNTTPTGYRPDGILDRATYVYDHDLDSSTPPQQIENAIKWYGYWYNDPVRDKRRNPLTPRDASTDLAFDPSEPVVFEPPQPAAGYFPYTPNPEDPSSSAGTGDPLPNADAVFVFGHDDEYFNLTTDSNNANNRNYVQSSNWPYLIRIRLRAHDRRGLIESGDAQHGLWFEHVIKVNRPYAVPD